ncbi:protease modulator HflC [Rhodoblastus acidophilus]|uniref:Protein HflC n=1 Tax=Candidatus Rhodoblastus alkanivorans TaxID=2954117 RepID=A0ABS9Z775_9HYPH|nr:protease modulator HflC [Candidatus Rhodoblastus alkanivorans]MCI4678685.1 protease modulator HflC [Candidatus Rhodoblastus alkanivorans]MCI4683519.1 protease modulator HflC [Candidatus Rhodoblastus alkanivorans]MDI4640834.1 protease modulator HflC [Rhodoblastus acidophilus]
MRKALIVLIALVVIATVVAMQSFYTVNQWESALVIRLGAPVAVVQTPGLKFKAPFIDSVVIFDRRLQLLEPPSEQVILGDQKRIVAQIYTRFRVTDPLRFYQSLHSMEVARAQLALSVDTAMRREFGQIDLPTLLSAGRPAVIHRVHADAKAKFAPMGLDVAEVRLHRADLPLETSQAIYDRMKSERQRQAKQLRAQGVQWAQEIEAKADRQRTVILSEAQRQAQITRGQGDAEANLILSNAQKGDPKFYTFYRSLQSYGKALADSAPVLLLTPDAEFLKALKSGPPETPADAK